MPTWFERLLCLVRVAYIYILVTDSGILGKWITSWEVGVIKHTESEIGEYYKKETSNAISSSVTKKTFWY